MSKSVVKTSNFIHFDQMFSLLLLNFSQIRTISYYGWSVTIIKTIPKTCKTELVKTELFVFTHGAEHLSFSICIADCVTKLYSELLLLAVTHFTLVSRSDSHIFNAKLSHVFHS